MEKRIKSRCNNCQRETNQGILFEHIEREDDEEIEHYSSISHLVIQCLGCDEVSFLIVNRFTDSRETPEKDWDEYHQQLPPTNFSDFEEHALLDESQYEQFPAMIRDLYAEIESAVKKDALLLAGLGLRTLVEAVCIQQNIPGKDLKEKIENLHSKGLISSTELPILDKLRVIGNASAHQIKRMTDTQLVYALSIINHVLISIYILPKINRRLKVK